MSADLGLHDEVAPGTNEPERLVPGVGCLLAPRGSRLSGPVKRARRRSLHRRCSARLPGRPTSSMWGRAVVTPSGSPRQNARAETANRKSDCLKRVHQKEIVLITIAAATRAHELCLERGSLERYRHAEQWIEVLEGDRLWVQAMQPGQSRVVGGRGSGKSDPPEIGVNINHGWKPVRVSASPNSPAACGHLRARSRAQAGRRIYSGRAPPGNSPGRKKHRARRGRTHSLRHSLPIFINLVGALRTCLGGGSRPASLAACIAAP